MSITPYVDDDQDAINPHHPSPTSIDQNFVKTFLRFSPPPFSEREQIQDIYIIFTCCIIFTCFLVPQFVHNIILPFLLTDEEFKVTVLKSN